MNIDFGYIVAVFVISIGSIILHELMHGVVAYVLGDQTAKLSGRLTLNPLKHIDPVMSVIVPVMLALINAPIFGGAKPVPINTRNLKGGEWGFAAVAIAGPLTNLILAFLFFLVGAMTGVLGVTIDGSLGYIPDMLGTICIVGTMVNIGFALFNFIPIPPLDGSRVLYALAPDGVRRFMTVMEQYGLIVIYALILLGGSLLSSYVAGGTEAIINFFRLIVGMN